MTQTEFKSKTKDRYLPFLCFFDSWSSKKSGGKVDDWCLGNADEHPDLSFNSLEDSELGFGNSLTDSVLALLGRFSAAALALSFSIACVRIERLG